MLARTGLFGMIVFMPNVFRRATMKRSVIAPHEEWWLGDIPVWMARAASPKVFHPHSENAQVNAVLSL